jgi:hypothetical protein
MDVDHCHSAICLYEGGGHRLAPVRCSGMEEALTVRRSRESDVVTILGLWDTAIAWLVDRGQTEQWGTELT